MVYSYLFYLRISSLISPMIWIDYDTTRYKHFVRHDMAVVVNQSNVIFVILHQIHTSHNFTIKSILIHESQS